MLLQGKETPALQEATAWQQNAGSWAEGLLERFPMYTDLLQPVALAVFEIRAGLAMIVPAVQQHLQSKATALQSSIAASLIGLPVPSSGGRALLKLHAAPYVHGACSPACCRKVAHHALHCRS